MGEVKKCSRCQCELAIEAFHVDKGHADGRASCCKACRALWVASRKSEVTVYNAQYYTQHKGHRLNQIHEYQKRHPEVKVKYRHQYRARKHHALGAHTLADLVAIFENQQGRCHYCGTQLVASCDGHFDHVVPLARGGTDNADNIVFACRACNWSKHDRTPEEWLKSE